MNFIKKSITLAAILYATVTVAQESKTVFSGNADFYYRYNFANTGNLENNNLTSFTNSNDSFELGMASIKASHEEGKASFFADLGFGKRAKEFTYNDANQEFMIKQINMTYEFSSEFKVMAGSFATHLGYEFVDAVDNKNYSMSYAFTNGPFFNTGVKAQYIAGKISIMAGLTNPTDFKTAIASKSNQKTVIAQFGYTEHTGSVFLNFTSGSTNPQTDNKQQVDLVATKKLNDKFTLGVNGTYATVSSDLSGVDSKSWFSGILYAQYAVAKNSSLAYRFEYLSDKDGALVMKGANILDNNIIANTLSMNFKERKFTFIPEIRFDNSSQEIFAKNKALDSSKSTASILFATTYSF